MSSTTGPPPNYYAILEISETATTTQIREAYKRAALKTHPDRVPADHPERRERTRKFQLVNDAYYTLSNAPRRREYDAQRKLYSSSSRTTADPFAEEPPPYSSQQQQGGGGSAAETAYSWAWNFFTNHQSGGGGGGATPNPQHAQQERQQTENAQFADVFEEMLREEGLDPNGNQTNNGGGGGGSGGKFWGTLGGLSGGALGFIVANVPGLVAGAVAGNRLGAVRDAKGKSVYAVFQELPQDDRSRLLSQLAAKVFSHAVGI